ncbi:hypothetical protein A8990_110128 [Paenibacillus taihuensis]|uniref:Uncharacterized protein n=1 Tax=Paenibacillus taihuensis TaxID=1156355 RepID=A0A3D9S7D8_9BACL|nr:hypothetical protein [Paenibacillus taihuensis]REE86518.1 hypothetical protein A8990_110128 [Paenibacillus taihuensis]
MRERGLMAFIILIMLGCAFYGGYLVGNRSDERLTENQARTVESQWVNEDTPPVPNVSVDGVQMKVKLSGYTWCPAGDDTSSCQSVDASIAQMEPVVVKGGAQIEIKAPERIKELTLKNMSAGFTGDSYYVPKVKGIYQYSIHCEWFLDQGQAEYYFAVEVK